MVPDVAKFGEQGYKRGKDLLDGRSRNEKAVEKKARIDRAVERANRAEKIRDQKRREQNAAHKQWLQKCTPSQRASQLDKELRESLRSTRYRFSGIGAQHRDRRLAMKQERTANEQALRSLDTAIASYPYKAITIRTVTHADTTVPRGGYDPFRLLEDAYVHSLSSASRHGVNGIGELLRYHTGYKVFGTEKLGWSVSPSRALLTEDVDPFFNYMFMPPPPAATTPPFFGFAFADEEELERNPSIPTSILLSYEPLLLRVQEIVLALYIIVPPHLLRDTPRHTVFGNAVLKQRSSVWNSRFLPRHTPRIMILERNGIPVIGEDVGGDLYVYLSLNFIQNMLLVSRAWLEGGHGDTLIRQVDDIVSGRRNSVATVRDFARANGLDLRSRSLLDTAATAIAAVILHEQGHANRHRSPLPLTNPDGTSNTHAFLAMAVANGNSIEPSEAYAAIRTTRCHMENEADEYVADLLEYRRYVPESESPIEMNDQALLLPLLYNARLEKQRYSDMAPEDRFAETHPFGPTRYSRFQSYANAKHADDAFRRPPAVTVPQSSLERKPHSFQVRRNILEKKKQ